jgi:hypothetical protein
MSALTSRLRRQPASVGAVSQYPPPEEYERDRKRIEAYKRWAQPIAAGLAAVILVAMIWKAWQVLAGQ